MSGSAGGNRIPRSAVEKTVKEYIDKVLSKVPGFKSAKVSGSYNTSEKQDFGDIDLITYFEGEDKKEFKKQLAKYLESLPDDVIVPFKSEKYAGKKTMNTGEIVTILYPITGMPGEFVQIDNIIALSEEEGDFKQNFLDYPAELQGLILGLVKVVTLEEDPNKVIDKMGIKNIPTLESNQEYEFNLSSAGLTLRIVTLGEDYKQLERTDVWKSSNWGDVKKLLATYNIDQSFKDLVSDLKKLKNPRSKNRIKGIFKSMVSIKSGEVNTPKGDNKQMALDTVAMLEKKYGSFAIKLINPLLEAEAGQQSIAVFPGAFKPPHASHLKAIQVIAPKVDKVYVYVSKQPRIKEGQIPIDADQAMAIWNLYKQKGLIPDNVEIKLANNATPVLDAYQEIEAHPENKYLAVFGKDEESRWKSVEKDREKYGHVTPFNIGNIKGLSASNLRIALKNKDIKAIKTFLPKEVTAKEYIQTLIGQKKLQEIVNEDIDPLDANTIISSIQTIVDGKRDVGYINLKDVPKDEIKKIDKLVSDNNSKADKNNDKDNEIKILDVKGNQYEPKIYYKERSKLKAEELKDIAEKHKGYLSHKATEDESRKIGKILGYSKESIDKYIEKQKLSVIKEIVTDTKVICDKCGWSWNIKDGGDDLYICHNILPSGDMCKHDNNSKENQNKTWDLEGGIVSLSKYMLDNGLNIKPLPKVKFISNDEENASNMLGKTAYYNPSEKSITLYTFGRHPKDILRSFSHEMIHHMQNLEGRLNNITTTNTNEDGDLPELEREAYELGNTTLRKWEDSIKNV